MTQISWKNPVCGDWGMAFNVPATTGPAITRMLTAANALVQSSAVQASASGFSFNVATGQNAAGVIQTAGDLPDAHWTVTNADSYKNAPIAYTDGPGDADFPGWAWQANGPGSSWITANPEDSRQGNMTFTLNFDLTGYNPADATFVGLELASDDLGTVALNGHVLGANNSYSLAALPSNGAGDFVAGVNTLVIQISGSDHVLEGVRLQGAVVDTVRTTPPGPVHWASAVSGNFTTAADWSGGGVPGPANDAILDPTGAAFTVTASSGQTVNSLQTAANAALSITAETFTAIAGTGTGANAGAIRVRDGATFAFAGGVANSGAIGLGGAGDATRLLVTAATILTGGGEVTLSDNAANAIVGAAAADVLTNVDNTISGSGALGGGQLTLVNQVKGVIDATGTTAALVLDTAGETLTNAGLIEGTGAAGLTIRNTTVDDSSGGQILAANGSPVSLRSVDIVGGTLTTSGAGVISAFGVGNEFSGVTSPLTLAGKVWVASGATLTLEGSIIDSGTLHLMAGPLATTLVVGAAGVTLSGGGQLVMDNSTLNRVTGAASGSTLTNVDDVIRGAGVLGDANLTLVNEAGGVINGGRSLGLTIDTGSHVIVNAGKIGASGAGGTTIDGAMANTGLLFAAGGTLTVLGAVTGSGRARVNGGGTLDFASGFNGNVWFDNSPTATGTLEMAKSQNYGGTVHNFSHTGGTVLDLADIAFTSGVTKASYAGNANSGVLTVTDGTHTAHIKLAGNYTTAVFNVSSDGHGGTNVVDPSPATARPSVALLAQHMAGLAAPTAGANAPAHDFAAAHPHLIALTRAP